MPNICRKKRGPFGNITNNDKLDPMDSDMRNVIQLREVKGVDCSPQAGALEQGVSSNSEGISMSLM
jgi:hypothetical protein